ncbi:MAG: hypothetical protein ABIA75_11220 [Candidatus Neomarinimicrobiota bacterium]
MIRYIVVSIIGGLIFGILDGMLNANPLAQKLYAVYKPIARESINIPAGLLIDLCYGFILAAIFLVLHSSLPGETALIKSLSYGCLIWFFRVVMYAASHWMMFQISGAAIAYMLLAGLAEMLILGIVYGLALRPVL